MQAEYEESLAATQGGLPGLEWRRSALVALLCEAEGEMCGAASACDGISAEIRRIAAAADKVARMTGERMLWRRSLFR
jgi:hypothetical protein